VHGGAVHLSSAGRPPTASGWAREADGRRWGERRGSRETGSQGPHRREAQSLSARGRPEAGVPRPAPSNRPAWVWAGRRCLCGGSSSAGRVVTHGRRGAAAPDSALVGCLRSRSTLLMG